MTLGGMWSAGKRAESSLSWRVRVNRPSAAVWRSDAAYRVCILDNILSYARHSLLLLSDPNPTGDRRRELDDNKYFAQPTATSYAARLVLRSSHQHGLPYSSGRTVKWLGFTKTKVKTHRRAQ